MEKKDDRRVRRTRQQLQRALLELLQEKPLEEITITELTGRADVNRGTFYGHYKDLYDMVEQLRAEAFGEFRRLLDAYSADTLRFGLAPILRDVFQFVQRNVSLLQFAVGTRQGSLFLEQLKDVIREKVSEEWRGLYRFESEQQRDYCLSFLVAGVVGMIQAWLEGGSREGPEEMVKMEEELILRGIEPWAEIRGV